MMSNPLKCILLMLVVTVSLTSAFSPAFVSRSSAATSTTTSLNIFGGGKKKPADKKGGGKDLSVFGGKGKRITVREDEDNAMWIEGEDGSRQSATGKDGKKKGK